MSAPARFHALLRRLFGRRNRPGRTPPPIVTTAQEPTAHSDPTPLFSLGDSKQELVASYRSMESEGA